MTDCVSSGGTNTSGLFKRELSGDCAKGHNDHGELVWRCIAREANRRRDEALLSAHQRKNLLDDKLLEGLCLTIMDDRSEESDHQVTTPFYYR